MNFKKLLGQSLVWRGLYFLSVLVMNIFLSRYFRAGGAGWIFFMSNTFSLVVILAGWTMENALTYYSARKLINDHQLSWFSIVWTFFVFIAVLFGYGIYLYLYHPAINSSRADYLFYATSYITGIQLTNCFLSLFYANRNFLLPNVIMVVLNTILVIIISTYPNYPVFKFQLLVKLFFAFFIVTGLSLAVAFIVTNGSWKRITLPSWKATRLLMKYALIALSANVIFFLVYRVDYWFVRKYCSSEVLGNYIQVSKLGQMLLVIPTIIASVVLPETAANAGTATEMKRNIMQLGKMTTILYVGLFLAIALTGQSVFPFVFGPTFRLMYIPFLLLLPGIWSLSNLYILSAYFSGINQVKVNVQGAVVALLVILAGDFLFIPRYGIPAAALVSTVGYSVNFIYSFAIFRK
jgi:O-antigen/teichoic acid export membrane protein